MNNDMIIGQLYGIRTQIDALIAQMIPDEGGCTHPNAINMSTMGDPYHYYCPDCKADFYREAD